MIVSRAHRIGGVEQWLYLNLRARAKATLLFVHGGPGWVDSPWAGVACAGLWGEVNTVHWDQRGCNRSRAASVDLSIDLLVSDALDVCRVIEAEHGLSRPVLVGHSWGAFLAVLAASRAPELFERYIGIGQLVANAESEPVSMRLLKRRAGERGRPDLLAELETMGADFYRSIPALFRQREIVAELGGELADPPSLEDRMPGAPAEYRAGFESLGVDCERVCLRLWPELIRRSLRDEVRRLELPVTLVQGAHDLCTPEEPVRSWLSGIDCAAGKELIRFDRSAHWPQLEESARFARVVLERV